MNGTGDQSPLAIVANSSAAGPSNWHIACFGELKQTVKGRVPIDIETTPGEGDARSFSRPTDGEVRRPLFCPHYPGVAGFAWAEQFGVHSFGSDAPGGQIRSEVPLKRRGAAKIKIRVLANAEGFQSRHCQMPRSVEVH